MQLHNLTIREAHELLTGRKISSVELTQAFLQRIRDVDPKVRSYVTVTEELALEQARQQGGNASDSSTAFPVSAHGWIRDSFSGTPQSTG